MKIIRGKIFDGTDLKEIEEDIDSFLSLRNLKPFSKIYPGKFGDKITITLLYEIEKESCPSNKVKK